MPSEDALVVVGTVTESLANQRFRVALEGNVTILAYLAGNLVRHRIRVVPGDAVRCELSPYDLTRGRIVRRE